MEFSCVDSTPTAHHIFSAQLLHRLALTCCQSVQSHIDPMHLHGSSHEAHCLRFAPKHPHLILIAQCRTPGRTWHHARALLPHLCLNQSSTNLNDPAKINGHSRVAPWHDTFIWIVGRMLVNYFKDHDVVFLELLCWISYFQKIVRIQKTSSERTKNHVSRWRTKWPHFYVIVQIFIYGVNLHFLK